MINHACDCGGLQGLRLGDEGPLLSHLLFADDSLFFLKASVPNCQAMVDIINSYCTASGQRVNFSKSSLFFSSNTHVDLQMQLSEVLGVPGCDNPGKYLGLPTMWGRSKKQALAFVKESVTKKIQVGNSCI